MRWLQKKLNQRGLKVHKTRHYISFGFALSMLFGCTDDSNKVSMDGNLIELRKEILATNERLSELEQRLAVNIVSPNQSAVASQLHNVASAKPGLNIDLSGYPFKGDPSTRIVIIEATDYQCAYCKLHKADVFPGIQQQLLETGVARYYALGFPLSGHGMARQSVAAANCAHYQGQFWNFNDELFSVDKIANELDLIDISVRLGMEPLAFKSCLMESDEILKVDVLKDMLTEAGVKGTPTFFLGKIDNSDVVSEIIMFSGAQPLDVFLRYTETLKK